MYGDQLPELHLEPGQIIPLRSRVDMARDTFNEAIMAELSNRERNVRVSITNFIRQHVPEAEVEISFPVEVGRPEIRYRRRGSGQMGWMRAGTDYDEVNGRLTIALSIDETPRRIFRRAGENTSRRGRLATTTININERN